MEGCGFFLVISQPRYEANMYEANMCMQEGAQDGHTVVLSTQGPLCFANAQRIKERLLSYGVCIPEAFLRYLQKALHCRSPSHIYVAFILI